VMQTAFPAVTVEELAHGITDAKAGWVRTHAPQAIVQYGCGTICALTLGWAELNEHDNRRTIAVFEAGVVRNPVPDVPTSVLEEALRRTR